MRRYGAFLLTAPLRDRDETKGIVVGGHDVVCSEANGEAQIGTALAPHGYFSGGTRAIFCPVHLLLSVSSRFS